MWAKSFALVLGKSTRPENNIHEKKIIMQFMFTFNLKNKEL